MNSYNNILQTPIEYLKGVGPLRADLLKKELNIFTFKDLLEHYPLRHLDKTSLTKIKDLNVNSDYAQIKGTIKHIEITGEKSARRMIVYLQDDTASIELVWFKGISYIQKSIEQGLPYLVFGKIGFFNGRPQIVHPEIELYHPVKVDNKQHLEPVYPSTEKLKARALNGRQIAKLTEQLFYLIKEKDLPENLPDYILQKLHFTSRYNAIKSIHFPQNNEAYKTAVQRLKFEELFIAQVRHNLTKLQRHTVSKGFTFSTVGNLFNEFYNNHLPFQLTGAQKRVLKEIRNDTANGKQMNRLLQGDVGSGKTIVALLSMLLAADNGFQSCMMAPTEILAQQHYTGISSLLQNMNVNVAILTGSTKAAERRKILAALQSGETHIIIGTHALIEDAVVFKSLGLTVIDEQHRFGVAQRAKLWSKASLHPHILVMTATPIPRTLAMTVYGDLDYSIMDELPPGRQEISTATRNEMARASVMTFVKQEINKGRQAYFIYPLIEESDKLAYEDLMQGYEQVKSFFPEQKYSISMVHGKMKPEQKETNMQRFVTGDTQIMVSTTVIEVGVNVPNATVMVIESAEKFGLSQLHQLRGRVGRGSEKSYCILLTGSKISNDAKERLQIMCSTNDGFKIAEKDLELRGPGDIEGTRQSGALNFKLASIVDDKALLDIAKTEAENIVEKDNDLSSAQNLPLKNYLINQKRKTAWSKIS